MRQFFGKYRGKVTNNVDPQNLGRIQVEAPAVLGFGRHSWAMPCTPYAGMQVGFYAIPPVGANVWVEFEGGDPDYPIWSGCFWGTGETPALPGEGPQVQRFKSQGINLSLSNVPGQSGFSIEVGPPVAPTPLSLLINPQGIELNNGDQTVVKIAADSIEASNGGQATIKLTPTDIELTSKPVAARLSSSGGTVELSHGDATVTLKADSVEVKKGTASIKVSVSGIELINNPAAVKLSTNGVEMSAQSPKVEVLPTMVKLSNGAWNVQVATAGVNVNNGPVEVLGVI
jgi:hypothetical protein